jgi:hypothetical protein
MRAVAARYRVPASSSDQLTLLPLGRRTQQVERMTRGSSAYRAELAGYAFGSPALQPFCAALSVLQ